MNTEGEVIRSQMAALRGAIGHDVEHTVAGLRTMVDWRHFVRHHPWACVGAAALAGFVLIPSKPKIVLQADDHTVARFGRGRGFHAQSSTGGKGAVEAIARMAGQFALRAATAYVTRRISESFAGGGRDAGVTPDRFERER